MMNNATFRANMENVVNVVNIANDERNMSTQEPGIHDLLARLSDLVKENRSFSYQIRDNLFGLAPTNGNSAERTIGCAKDAIEDSIAWLTEANDILRYVINHL